MRLGKLSVATDDSINKPVTYKTYKVFLDDTRSPYDTSWIVVRSTEELINLVSGMGRPMIISFDHDLGIDQGGNLLPDGGEAAKWLVANDMAPKEFIVHSQNPVGAQRIEGILSGHSRYLGRGRI